jgi:hypothetical protein
MAPAATKNLARLARLALELEQRRLLCVALQSRLEAVEQAGIVVDGEKEMLAELLGRLDKAQEALTTVGQAAPAEATSTPLAELGQLLEDVEWDVAEQVLGELTTKDEEQQKKARDLEGQIADYESRIAVWKGYLQALVWPLTEAQKVQAPVTREDRERLRLQALVEQAERALRERKLDLLAESLRTLEAEGDRPKQLVGEIQKKIESTRRFARQADLLLLRSPLVQQRNQYTVLLRTPSEPGSHGINIQDSSTVVEQDRERITRTLQEVTAQINAGLARQFAAQPAREAPAGEEAAGEPRTLTPVGVVGTGQVYKDANTLAQDTGDLMYRLFMPEQMQRYLTATPCSITITTNDLELPWELMWCEESEHKFLCLDRPVARMPMGRAFPRQEPGTIRSGEKLRFLLIYADPKGNLPEAGREIEQIKSSLEADWKNLIEVVTLTPGEAQGQKLNEMLLSGTYDVIHYAGHAAFDEDHPELSGLLLAGEEVFFAQKIRRLLEGRPLVFLNACESGRTANELEPQVVERCLQQPAEGLAPSFVYGGALGCIGALWPVYDRPAAEFAIHFYNRVLEGHRIGEAMRQARLEIRKNYPNQITWAAFTLYGDPTLPLAV